MPSRIHLIENLGYIKKIEGDIHESGFWAVPSGTAETLVGGDVYFHRKKKETSFFGGRVVGYRIHEEKDEYRGRIIFLFESSRGHKNVPAGGDGWQLEKKVVRED